MSISNSKDRMTFQLSKFVEKATKEGKMEHPDTLAMIDYYEDMKNNHNARFDDESAKENNLEYDLLTSQELLEKVRADEVYAQNLYAALCNNQFRKLEVENKPDNLVKVLKDGLPKWSCSWRYAGGIIADMREEGDYIDWYCSGINKSLTDEEIAELTDVQKERYETTSKFVNESVVTDEIEKDLLSIGWEVLPYED